MFVSGARNLRQQVEVAWTRFPSRLVAFPFVLLGVALRLYRIESNGLNLDEAWSLWMAQHSPIDIVWKIWLDRGDATPPGYYLLLHGFLSLGDGLVFLRALSVIAGALAIWVTFRLAEHLFGLRAAALSALLVAIAPLQIEYSQEARAYALTQLLELLSLYFLARIVLGEERRWHWVGLVASTAAALYTFYLVFLLVIFQNLVFAFLWYRKRLHARTRIRWLASEAILGLLYLPIAIPALIMFREQEAGFGQTWLGHPGLQSVVKTAILFGTGDPSYGPIGFTPARAASLLVVAGIVAYGVWPLAKAGYHHLLRKEVVAVNFLTASILIPWGLAFSVSQMRPVYHEKYLLFLMPLILMLFAWALTRARTTFVAVVLLVGLVSLTVAALRVQESSPLGEQWREVSAYLQDKYQPGDIVIISPAFYVRPVAYYFLGEFPVDVEQYTGAPAVLIENDGFTALRADGRGIVDSMPQDLSASSERIWFVTGFAPANGDLVAALERDRVVVEDEKFLGARVRLMR